MWPRERETETKKEGEVSAADYAPSQPAGVSLRLSQQGYDGDVPKSCCAEAVQRVVLNRGREFQREREREGGGG